MTNESEKSERWRWLGADFPLIALLISGVAVLASQVPPAYTLWRNPTIEVRVGGQISSNLTMTGMTIVVPLLLFNRGSADGIVKSVSAFITRDDGTLSYRFDGGIYQPLEYRGSTTQTPAINFTHEVVEASRVWKNSVQFASRYDENNLSGIYELAGVARTELAQYRSRTRHNRGFTLSPATFDKAKEVFLTHASKVVPGKYFFLIVVRDENDEAIETKVFEFQLREYESSALMRGALEYLQMGGSLLSEMNAVLPPILGVPILMQAVSDSKQVSKILKRYESGKYR